jgi:hypothetical protein
MVEVVVVSVVWKYPDKELKCCNVLLEDVVVERDFLGVEVWNDVLGR